MSESLKKAITDFEAHFKENIEASTLLPKFARLPKRYEGLSFRNYEIDETEKARLIHAIAKDGRSLFISGSCGTGKTHLAVALMYEYCRENFRGEYGFLFGERRVTVKQFLEDSTPVFLPTIELFAELRNAIGKTVNDEDIISRYTKKPLVILDDLGSEKVSEYTRENLYLIIDRVYRDGGQLIVTSNLSLGEIADRIDDRIASRLVDICDIVKLEGEDRRVSKKVRSS